MNAFNVESEASPLPAIALESTIEGILETETQGPSAPSSNLTGQSQTTTISEWGVDLPMSEHSQDNTFEGTGGVDDYDVFDDFLCAGETEDHDFFDGFLCTGEPEGPNMFDQPLFYRGQLELARGTDSWFGNLNKFPGGVCGEGLTIQVETCKVKV
ncbi:hypothetical protein HO173_004814 [Letharia columbiana]|uniref:Uncharacterized protein n=1 Tax=Letharia columbiana TaxID=112416 RepID=A0A8H6L645_9LECA|nr:uncharacterized protein HO173_004814 [Letharia columbiana]KAF6236937.1 hypothetical protein HO173_004814 [Letharia columbiana]